MMNRADVEALIGHLLTYRLEVWYSGPPNRGQLTYLGDNSLAGLPTPFLKELIGYIDHELKRRLELTRLMQRPEFQA